MDLLPETLKYITTTHNTTPSISAIPLYLNHSPQDTTYPIITFDIINNNPTMAMGDYNYAEFRINFRIFGNEQDFSTCIDISKNIEDTFHRKSNISLNNDVTLICSKISNNGITFFNQNEKIWQLSQDYKFLVGK